MKLDFERETGFFDDLSKDEKLEILFEDRKNMKLYIFALKSTLKDRGIEFEEEVLAIYKRLRRTVA
ncbi:TPA: hypothetical protein ACN98R_004175 [Vibrio parahaemolyticus]